MTESNSSTLTDDQIAVIRRVSDTVNSFYATDVLTATDLPTRHASVVSASRELNEIFPTVFADASAFHETFKNPYNDATDYTSPLFDVMLDLIRFNDVTRFDDFAWLFVSLNDTLTSLCSFCEGFDLSSATWVD